MDSAAVDKIFWIIIFLMILVIAIVGAIVIMGVKDFDKISDEDWREFCKERGYEVE